jgi:hypothetical protein
MIFSVTSISQNTTREVFMNFEDDKRTATELLTEWFNSIGVKTKDESFDLKEDASGFITSWKARDAKRVKEIDKFVDDFLEKHFV